MIDYDSPLVEIPRPTDALALRATMIANALSVVNVEAGDPRLRPVLADLLGPCAGAWDLGRPFRCWQDAHGRWHTEGVSTCGLVAEGLWRRMGVDALWLREEYVPGTSISRAVRFAQRLTPRSAWHTPAHGQRPEPGDYVVIGRGIGTHALTAIAWEGDTLVSVDGGQVGRGGLQAVHRCRRPWLTSVDAASLGGRAVQGWIALEMLPGRATCEVPT